MRGIAGVVTGTVVLGVGGRLVMLASRFLHPDAAGRLTENGNRIGEFTVSGTAGLILFGGLVGGLMGGVIWTLIAEWIPRNPIAVGVGAVMLGGFNLVDSHNRDFVILQDPAVDIALLLGLVWAFGAALVVVDSWLDMRLPPAGGVVSVGIYSVLVAGGAPLAIPTIGNYLDTEFCFCSDPPIWTGVFLVATAVATVAWWVMNLRGADRPPNSLAAAARTTVLLAVLAGGFYLAGEVAAIF